MSESLLQSLFDEEDRRPLSVSELNRQVCAALERSFASVWLEGEIVNFSAARSGHWYFSLHDERALIRAACYKGSNYRIRFKPFDGLQVRVRGRLTLYEPRGEFQILVESLEPVGEGALRVAYEQIKAKLGGEGLFDEAHKRAIPPFPRRIGVVTSPNGAAFFDILNVLGRRARSVSVILFPSRVQGETAGEEIATAIRIANEMNASAGADRQIDALIVGRGGGSAEDLWAFNEEIVARAIRASAIPVISAVGHEIDYTIADFCADLRAPTPSAAAELVAQREADVIAYLAEREAALLHRATHELLRAQSSLQTLAYSPALISFPLKVREHSAAVEQLAADCLINFESQLGAKAKRLVDIGSQLAPHRLASKLGTARTRLAVLRERLSAATSSGLSAKQRSLKVCMATLDALSPLSVLDRGYSITETAAGEIVRRADQAVAGDVVRIRLKEGELTASVRTPKNE